MRNFAEKVLDDIRKQALLDPGAGVLVALSGGPDSVCLAMLLHRLRERLDLTLAAGHVNYGLRGEDSEGDEAFVREFCSGLGIPLHLTRADPRPGGNGNLEENARIQRYEFLAEIACREKMVIATGHNADDQAETFLLNLLRGAGYRGLAGMLPARVQRGPGGGTCRVIRPLLHCSRAEIIQYLEASGQAFRIDRSNLDPHYDRNWIRHELLPLLAGRFKPRPGERIARAAEMIGEAAGFLTAQAEARLTGIAVREEDRIRIPVGEVLPLPEVMQREMLKLAAGEVKGDLTDLTSRHIFALAALLSGQSGRKACLPGGLEASREFDCLVIRKSPLRIPPFTYRMQIPGSIDIPEAGKRLTISFRKVSPAREPGDGSREVVVRNRRPGDRLKVAAGRPRQSFPNLCHRHRIPESERDRILIIELPDHSHWVEGTGMPSEIGGSGLPETTISINPLPSRPRD